MQLALYERQRGHRPRHGQRREKVPDGTKVGPSPSTGDSYMPIEAPFGYGLAKVGGRRPHRLGCMLEAFDGPDDEARAKQTGGRPSLGGQPAG